MAKKKVSNWIDVKKSIPNYQTPVLISTEDAVGIGYIVKTDERGHEWSYIIAGQATLRNSSSEIIAWQPLIDFYKKPN